jgi:23S rRNA (pseudouridine1915-N3)-methyltransferase
MRIAIHAVGRMKAGPERELAARYLDRFAKTAPAVGLEFAGLREWPESRAAGTADRMREESERIATAAEGGSMIVLDERGDDLSSRDFATMVARLRDDGERSLLFALGGPDGHDPGLRRTARRTISFGSATWPHQIARIMLAEQLYRAVTILSGHPYHRD